MKVEAPRRAVTMDEVRAHREAIKRLGERNIRVFGSVARGEATPGSDLDLLVDVERGHGYFDMAGFALGVEDELGVMTQVATLRGLKLPIRDRVLRRGRRPGWGCPAFGRPPRAAADGVRMQAQFADRPATNCRRPACADLIRRCFSLAAARRPPRPA